MRSGFGAICGDGKDGGARGSRVGCRDRAVGSEEPRVPRWIFSSEMLVGIPRGDGGLVARGGEKCSGRQRRRRQHGTVVGPTGAPAAGSLMHLGPRTLWRQALGEVHRPLFRATLLKV